MNRHEKILPDISIVVPLYCEEGNVGHLVTRLSSVIKSMNENFEIILVDDGSTDSTWEKIELSAKDNPFIKGIRLSRNFGHQHALLAGLTHASGCAIISMDGDLQHPPELIPQLIDKWREGFKIVNTIRDDVRVASFFKRFSSKYFYKCQYTCYKTYPNTNNQRFG